MPATTGRGGGRTYSGASSPTPVVAVVSPRLNNVDPMGWKVGREEDSWVRGGGSARLLEAGAEDGR
jgi:hypothetical protein